MRLRTALILLTLATAIPIVAFALLAAGLVVSQENENFVSVAKTRNRATMSAIDAEVQGAINTLAALSVGRTLRGGDLQIFHGLAQQVLATQPSWNNLLLHDAEGRQLVNASLPWGTPLLEKPVAASSFERTVRTRQPAVEDLAVAPLLKNRLGVPIRVPVLRDGQVVYVLTAMLSPDAFQRLLAAQNLPQGWVSGLVDSQGRLIARVPPKPPGDLASADYRKAVDAGPQEGWYRGTNLEGADTYTAFLRSDRTGWSIGYAIPVALVHGGGERATWLMGAGIALSLVAAGVIGLWLSRRIATPMSELADAAALLGRGAVPPRVHSTVVEVERLSTALHEATKAIDERDRDLRRSQDELRQQTAELRRADTHKSQFLALLSHELRNPLAPLRTGLAILQLRRDPQGMAETQAMMERQIAHMARLIDDLLDVSRIDRGQLELRHELVAVDAIVRSAIETAKPGIEAKQHQLLVRYASEPLYVQGDPVRLSQVVSNLLNNAAKFTPSHGHISISMGEEDGSAVLAIQDDGAGFPSNESQRIFEMFVQLEGSRSEAAGGLGLGLTIVRSLVEMHGGSIEARSAGPGKGAAFTVRLPKAKPEIVAQPAALPMSSPPARHRVLVVDDNPDAADSLGEMLTLHHFDVRVVYDGEEAFKIAKSFKPEVAFIDLNMPRMDGLELALALGSEPWATDVRLVALTGMGQSSDIEATRAAGFHAHLTKPAAPDEIVRLAGAAENNVVSLRPERRAS